jgi:enoyl-CoA hydratase/3-hydroxyacyl-CoA dehydrogenase
MSTSTERTIRKLGVIGAGNMGSGIAQKMASEGFPVVLVDLDDEKVARGIEIIERTLAEGVERKVFRPDKAKQILGRIRGSSNWDDLADCDLVVEAVFEDEQVKRKVFARLDEVCRPDAILATNTSSFSVSRLAEGTGHPERVLGLHYFYHPAKNRLVEVVPGRATAERFLRAAWSLQEQTGKTPIAAGDVFGFVVNRFFVPWLNEAVRLRDEQVADTATIEEVAKKTFRVGMGPFELMNLTGTTIALHAATTLGQELGRLYAPADGLRAQVESGQPWNFEGQADGAKSDAVAERMQGVVFLIAAALVDEGVGTLEDTDIGARVGLRWPKGPFEMMNRLGVDKAARLAESVARRWELPLPKLLETRAARREPFPFRVVRSEVRDGVATLTINRPDAMNALNEAVVSQLHEAFRAAAADPQVRGIIIAGAGKAFVAGADIRFFVRNIDAGNVDRIQEFSEAGHALLNDIDASEKPVIARIHGLALGGGLELALACSRIVATPGAILAFPETGIGIYPGLGGTQRTARRISPDLAKWLIYTGEMLTGQRAQEIGLVDEIATPAELDHACREAIESGRSNRESTWPIAFAELGTFFGSNRVEDIRLGKADAKGKEQLAKAMQRVASKAPLALGIAEELINKGAGRPLEEGLQMELDSLREIFATEDAYEGLSTLGKKKPSFKGR